MAVYRFKYMAGGGRGTPYREGNVEVKAEDRETAEALALTRVSTDMRMGPSLVSLEFMSERP